jgi:hypothetical protein
MKEVIDIALTNEKVKNAKNLTITPIVKPTT